MATNYEEQIKQMYASDLASQTEQLKTDYEAADSDYIAQQEKARKAADQSIRSAKVESTRAAMNNEEYYAANGLTSGAKAQARLALNTQLQSNLTAIRTAQQEADAETERQRGLLAQEYASAIRKAQADNDLALAQALYTEAKDAESKLLAKKEASAQILAQAGDFSGYGTVYGMTPEQVQSLTDAYNQQRNAEIAAANASAEQAQLAKDKAIFEQKLDVAKLLAEETGDYTALGQLYGLSDADIAKLNEQGSGDSRDGDEGDEGDENYSMVDTDATNAFKGTVPTRREYSRYSDYRAKYGSYDNYLEAMIDEWLTANKLTNNEAATLMAYYGLV